MSGARTIGRANERRTGKPTAPDATRAARGGFSNQAALHHPRDGGQGHGAGIRKLELGAPDPADAALGGVSNWEMQQSLRGNVPSRRPFLAKSELGAPDDPLERQADLIADRVMSGAAPRGDDGLAESAGATLPPTRPAAERAADLPGLGAGEPLPAVERQFFEGRLGIGLDSLRVHHGPDAWPLAHTLGARAFAAGDDLVFARGAYSPGTPHGRRLIGHEIAHTLQKTGGARQRLRRQPDSAQRDVSTDADTTQTQVCSVDSSSSGPACEPITENPLEAYPYLIIAIGDQLQSLQDAAYRREHLRQGVPFDGPEGLFFAQAPLESFLTPGTEYVSRDELVAALLPAMQAAASEHSDVEPYVAEIARNETARLYLEPLRNRLVNVELVDPDGKDTSPTRLKFVVDFIEVQDDHGSIPLPSLDAISKAPYSLIEAGAKVDARQLSEIALLQARTEWMEATYQQKLADITANPEDYALQQVTALHDFVAKLSPDVDHIAEYLFRNNQDLVPTVANLKARTEALEAASTGALNAARELRHQKPPPDSLTFGEIYDENAEDIRRNRDEDWEKGGFVGYAEAAGNELGLGASTLLQGAGDVASGFYQGIHADRVRAYRRGLISYNDYSEFHASDLVKGALMDLAVFAPGYGGELGSAAAGLFGLEEGTAAATVVEGQTVGFVSGAGAAMASDVSSLMAAHFAGSESEKEFQRNQIGGPWSWLSAGAKSSALGGAFGLASAAFPQPTALQGGPRADVGAMGPQRGIVASLKRSMLNKITAATLSGAEPLRFEVDGGPVGEQLFSMNEDLGPVAPNEPGGLPAAPAQDLADVQGAPVPEADADADPADIEGSTATAIPGQPDVAISSMGIVPASGERLTTRTQWKAQESARRWGMAVDQFVAGFEPTQVAAEAETVAPDVATINVQAAIRQAILDVRNSLARPVGNASFGTRLHAALARILRVQQLPPGVAIQVEQPLRVFANLPPQILGMTVRDWLRSAGRAHAWLESSLPSSVLNTTIGNLRVDAAATVADQSVIFDLTSRERESHLAKTTLYTVLLAEEGKITRVQEYYWVRWRWRGQ